MVVDFRPLFPWIAAFLFGAAVFGVGKLSQLQSIKKKSKRKASELITPQNQAATADQTALGSAAPAFGQTQTPTPGNAYGFGGAKH